VAFAPEQTEARMFGSERKGSTAPMWWGILLVLAFTVAATINHNWSDDAQASVSAQTKAAR
jgi:hypothetical protein